MKCPIDDTTLTMADRQGVEIDYCPQCRGVWLERGELDKIIDRSASAISIPKNSESHDSNYSRNRHDDDYRSDDQHYNKKRHKEGFLGDLFDF